MLGSLSSFTPSSFPVEIILVLLTYLTVSDKIKLLSLNRSWRIFMEKTPRAWQTLDFDQDHCFSQASVKRYCEKANYNVSRLSTHQSLKLAPILQTLNGLSELNIKGGTSQADLESIANELPNHPNLKYLILDGNISMQAALTILEKCRRLEVFKIGINQYDYPSTLAPRIGPSFKKLQMIIEWSEVARFPKHLLDDASGLEVLRIGCAHISITQDFRHMSHLRHLALYYYRDLDVLLLPPSVEYINLRERRIDGMEFREISPLPRLKILHLFCHRIEERTRSSLFEQIGLEIETLQLMEFDYTLGIAASNQLSGVSQGWIDAYLKSGRFSKMKQLGILISGVTDETLASISFGCPILEELDVSYSHGVTSAGIRRFVKDNTNIKRLETEGCPEIGVITLNWIESRGILLHVDSGTASNSNYV